MAKRFAIVLWWLGALLAAGGALCVVGGLLAGLFYDHDAFIAIYGAGFLLLPAIACWSMAYVLAGSFWRPPAIS